MSDETGDRPAHNEPRAHVSAIQRVRALFRAELALVLNRDEEPTALTVLVDILESGSDDPPRLSNSTLPLLALPVDPGSRTPATVARVLVAAEGADRNIAAEVAALLDPRVVGIDIVHVTWLPGIVTSPLGPEGIDNPQPPDLLLYRGAHEALIDTAQALRDAGFSVHTHLREHRHPSAALLREIEHLAPAMTVLGLGKHGAGIGRDILRETRVPVLYVAAR